MYKTLCGEPFLYRIHEVSKLTDWHIWNILLEPAHERARDLQRRMKQTKERDPDWEQEWEEHWAAEGEPEGVQDSYGMPTKEAYIKAGMECFGMSRERLEKEWEAAMGGEGTPSD